MHSVNLMKTHVLVNFAQSQDGFLADSSGQSQLSSPEDWEEVHQIRARVDAVIVGIETVLKDDPRLTARISSPNVKQPLRIVLDSRARTPIVSRVLGPEARTWIIATQSASPDSVSRLSDKVEVKIIGAEWVDLKSLLKICSESGVQKVLVEGGSRVINSFLQLNLVDEIRIATAPVKYGTGVKALADNSILRSKYWQEVESKQLGSCVVNRWRFVS